MRQLKLEELTYVGGGDSWGGTPEGQAPGPTAQAAINDPMLCFTALIMDSVFGTNYFDAFACRQ